MAREVCFQKDGPGAGRCKIIGQNAGGWTLLTGDGRPAVGERSQRHGRSAIDIDILDAGKSRDGDKTVEGKGFYPF